MKKVVITLTMILGLISISGAMAEKPDIEETANEPKQVNQETNVKLEKVREFDSYEKYEKYIGVTKKPSRIKIEDETIKFFNENGELIKIKEFKKDVERPIIMPNENGVLIAKGNEDDWEFEIYDNEGKYKGKINENIFLYTAPNGKYFIGLDVGEDMDMVGPIRIYDSNGKLIHSEVIFKTYGIVGKVDFYNNSRYAVISIMRSKEYGGGIIIYDKERSLIRKIFNKDWDVSYSGIAFLESGKSIILSTNKGIYKFSIEGKQIWFNEEVRSRYNEKEKIGWISLLSVSPNENDIIGYAWPGIVYVLSIEDGNLIKKIELPESIRYKYSSGPILINEVNHFLIKKSGSFKSTHLTDTKKKKTIYLINKKGEFIWKRENVNLSVDAELTESEEFVVKEKGKVYLYRICEK